MINILLSVRPPFSGFIMNGQKTWELRKNAPRIPRGEHVTLWLYESGKDGERAIIGKCTSWRRTPVPNPYLFQCTAMDIAEMACVSMDELKDYWPCYAWAVQHPVRLPAPVPLSAIGLTRPPQSWQYITADQAAIIEKYEEPSCSNCDHWNLSDCPGTLCWECKHSHEYPLGHWEPRKEGE